MRAYDYYMHENCMDVCLQIIKVPYRDDKRVKVKAVWVNLGYTGNPYVIHPQPSSYTILKEDLKHWKNITSKIHDKRTKPGLPV